MFRWLDDMQLRQLQIMMCKGCAAVIQICIILSRERGLCF